MRRSIFTVLSMAVAFILLLAPVALFAHGTSGSAAGAPEDGVWWKGLIQGVLGGILASLIGWAKNKSAQTGVQAAVDSQKLIQTCVFGALVGLAAWSLGKSPSDMIGSLESVPVLAAFVFISEAVAKAFWRHGASKARCLIADVKGSK